MLPPTRHGGDLYMVPFGVRPLLQRTRIEVRLTQLVMMCIPTLYFILLSVYYIRYSYLVFKKSEVGCFAVIL